MDELSIDEISPRFYHGAWVVMSKGGRCGVTSCIPDHDIQLAYQGAGVVVVDGVEYPMERGDVLTVFPGESFYEKAAEDSAFARYYIHFDFFRRPEKRRLTPTIDGSGRWPRLTHLENDVPVREICSDIIMLSLAQKSVPLRHILDGKMHSLLGIVMAQHLGVSTEVSLSQLKSRRNIFKAERYIRENYTREITIEQLAEIAELSPCYFVTIFKEVIGKSPKDYLIDHRLEQAKRLFMETGHNIAEVAALVGYEDAAYFSHLFKRKEGISPSRFLVKFALDEKYTG